MISGLRACLLCSVIAGAGVVAETDADGSLQDVLAAALEANERLARLAEGLTASLAAFGYFLRQRQLATPGI